MLLRYICFSFAVFFTLSSSLIAGKDLLIEYKLPLGMKKKLHTEVIKDSIPDPRHYHVTLFHVQNVDKKDYKALRNRLQNINKLYHSSTQFIPEAAVELNSGFLAIVPTELGNTQLKLINSHLYQELEKFNLDQGTSYGVNRHALPSNYTPHITIARPDYIHKNRINVDNTLINVNFNLAATYNLNGGGFEVLQASQIVNSTASRRVPKENISPRANLSFAKNKPTLARSAPKKMHRRSKPNTLSAAQKKGTPPAALKKSPELKSNEQTVSKERTASLANSNSLNQKMVWRPVQKN